MNISWTDRLKNEEVLYNVKEEKNILYTVKKKEGWLYWSQRAWELPSIARYWRKHKGKNRSDGKAMKKI